MDFLPFLGSYWWLIFPLFGVLGAAGKAWEKGARQRHQRRLEILKAKSELGASPAGTRRGEGGSRRGADADFGGATTAGSRASRLQRLFDEHDAVTARWLEYELDVAKIIAFPAMSDGRQPLTAAFLRAKRKADSLRPDSAKARIPEDALAEYRDAVDDFATSFEIAERDARRLKDSSFTETERKRLETAKQLLSVAIDQAATPAERQLAYRRVREELDGLISISDEAIEVLEEKVALELTAGHEAPSPSPGTSVTDAVAPGGPPAATAEPGPRSPPPRGTASPPGRITGPRPRP